MKKRIVVDASVIAVFFTSKNKELVESCSKILEDIVSGKCVGFAPSFLAIEITNAVRFSEPDHNKQYLFIEKFYEIPLELVESQKELIVEAVRRSQEVNDTVYDALYHVTAQALDATFLTCDRKYYERAKHFGDIELIR